MDTKDIELHILSNWGAHVPKPRVVAEHWLKHYKKLGADKITILLHCPEQNEQYEKMYNFLVDHEVDVVPWIGPHTRNGRTKAYNKRIIPAKFKNYKESNLWVMAVDDDEFFSLTPNIADAKVYLSNVENTFPNQQIFVSGRRMHMKRCDESIPSEVLSDVSIYDQFPCEFPVESFFVKKCRGHGKHRNNINKVIAINFVTRFRQGQHSLMCVPRRKILGRGLLDLETEKQIKHLQRLKKDKSKCKKQEIWLTIL